MASATRARWVLLLALLLVTACGRAPDLPRSLREFLQGGPGPGTWEVQGLSTRRTTWIAPHWEDSGWLLRARATVEGRALAPCVVLRSSVAREFLEGPWDLFARNYAPFGEPEQAETRDGAPALKLRWVPRVEAGETSRYVWFDPQGGSVLQIEDVATQGQRVRGIYRVSGDMGGLDPARVRPGGPDGQDLCVQSEPEPTTLESLIDKAPFPLVGPAYLPAGYERIAARYEELARRDAPAGGAPREPIRLVSLLYSDGLGLISIGIALRADMDALQDRLAVPMSDDEPPGGCSTLPPDVGNVDVGAGRVLRRRVDLCRTVLRLDGVLRDAPTDTRRGGQVSATLLSRNELPGDEYVKVMESLTRIAAP